MRNAPFRFSFAVRSSGRPAIGFALASIVLLAGFAAIGPPVPAPALPTQSSGASQPTGGALPPLPAATSSDPIFTTYAAPLARSEYLVDEGYHLRFYAADQPLAATTDSAGSFGVGFVLGGQVAHNVGGYNRAPTVRESFANFARFDFEPFAGLRVDALFTVYSSRQALLILSLENGGDRPARVGCYAFATSPSEPYAVASLTEDRRGLVFGHSEPREAWSESPPPQYENVFHDALLLDRPADAWSSYPAGDARMLRELRSRRLNGDLSGRGRALVVRTTFELEPGARTTLRIVRAVAPRSSDVAAMLDAARPLFALQPDALEREAAGPYRDLPRLALSPGRERVYRSAFSLVRQNMLPPEGRTRFNYYVFSREPTWSWGHDGQVFHESLSMLAYAWMDAKSAMDSQRVFIEAQEPDGYMPYRVGPYVVRTFPVNGQKTSSAPFFSWTNGDVYRTAVAQSRAGHADVTVDEARRFLEEAYTAGGRFAEFWFSHRDNDHDGLLEWGGNAVLECVRDSQVPIWQMLGPNDDTAPSRLEALDLNAMMVKELRALADMARELDRPTEARSWTTRADDLAARINKTMWDPETKFYYNVDRETHRFVTPAGLDLRRMEIIGFLPLWAGITNAGQTAALIAHLTNPHKFWRRFGVPTLAADDPGYQPLITRCCQWNGAVWMEWNYLVFDGLMSHGRVDLASELADRMIEAATIQLSRNHRFWESYSPDQTKVESPMNYIWDSILARVLIDLHWGAGSGK